MKKNGKLCLFCGGNHVLKRSACSQQMVTERELRLIRAGGLGFCLTALAAACFSALFSDLCGGIAAGIDSFELAAGIIGVALLAGVLLGGLLLLGVPLLRKKRFHYKCSSCGSTWEY